MSLTDTQRAVLQLIAERIQHEGMPPSQTEIARAMGFRGVRAAQYHLDALEQAGAIERVPGRARGIRVRQPPQLPQAKLAFADDADEAIRLPVLGRVAAGAPIGADAPGEWSDLPRLLLDRGLFRPMPDYLLRVEGDSMRDEGILEGDLIGVQRAQQATHGAIVIARIDDEITVKQLDIRARRIRLLPRNPAFAPIEIEAGQDFAIEGLYCGLLRPNR